jgi:hypothetical protein
MFQVFPTAARDRGCLMTRSACAMLRGGVQQPITHDQEFPLASYGQMPIAYLAFRRYFQSANHVQ